MRVLWFTNTPSLASEYLQSNSKGGGWIASLERHISKVKEIELGVAFHYNIEEKKSFTIGLTNYFALPDAKEKGKLKNLYKRWMHEIEPEYFINWYLEIIEDFKPDIIHIFGTEQSFGLISSRVSIPVIIQIQGNLTVISKKWFSGLSYIDILKYSDFGLQMRAYSLWHDYFAFSKKAKREQQIFGSGKIFIGRTDWDRRITQALSYNRLYFHCDELLREVFYQFRWEMPANQKIILYSTLSPSIYKGMETILETATILKKNTKINFEWQVAGINGNEEVIRIIEKKYKSKFSDQNICFKGSLNPEDLIKGLLLSNFFIHTSHIENSPNSVCESMLLGMPIIATSTGGTPSILKDKKEGLLVQDGDPFALAGAIIELIDDKETANTLGENARDSALIRHNPERVVAALTNIYKTLLIKSKLQIL